MPDYTTVRSTTAGVLAGVDNTLFVTPANLAALWKQGVDVASAGTTTLGDGGYFNITGTTGITDIDFTTDLAGRWAWLKFAGILTLTHSSTLILPGAANIVTAAGDTALFISEGSDVVRCVAYRRAANADIWTDLQSTGLIGGAVGFRNIPQNSQSAAYTTVAADSGKHILHPAADTNARTFTIDSNANVAYPVGTAITFINETSQVVTIAITSDTLVLAGTGTTGSRSLAQYGVATAIKITSTKWYISGSGLT